MKKVLIGCLVVLLIALVLVVFLFWLVFIRELPKLEAALSLPGEVTLGSTVDMVVTASNEQKLPVILDSIDIDESLFRGFQVVRIEPEPKDTFRVPILNQRGWSFGKEIQPGESISVTFQLKAVTEGRFSGDVDVCNPSQDFKTLLADVIVKAPAEEKNSAGTVP